MATDEKVSAPYQAPPVTFVSTRNKGNRKATIDAALASVLPSAIQQLITAGYPGVATSLQNDHGVPQESTIQKTLTDQPVYVHWSKSDMAPGIRTNPATKLSLMGALRGYRMARASHGCNAGGAYYYEVLILPPPSPAEILQALPSNARLGDGLREQLEAAIQAEKADTTKKSTSDSSSAGAAPNSKKRKIDDDNSTSCAVSHVRLGWSMRTADLQAPVGYDAWSYGIRSVNGALVHESVRRDSWGGDAFGEGDIIGCYISLEGNGTTTTEGASNNNNNIRFFKNGECLGEVILTKGKLDGGYAFEQVTPGTYYPAVSTYMGASVRANFGPYFTYPPKKRLGIQYAPVSSVRAKPDNTDPLASANVQAVLKLFKKPEHQTAVRKAIEYEANLRAQAYKDYMTSHIASIRSQRQARGVPTTDLPAPEPKNDAI